MAIRTVVTRGYGNGTFNGTIPLVALRGYIAGEEVAVEEEVEQPTGGWWYTYDHEYKVRERKRKERERLEAKARQIKDKLDRELALEFRKQEKEQYRIDELRRLSKLAQEYKEELRETVSQKAILAVENAIIKGSYSAMEQLERELAKSKEEEEFLIQATSIILNS